MLLAAALNLGACAFGQDYDYQTAEINIENATDRSVSAAVVDRRPYVLDGSEAPTFVGVQRGGYGNPFDVTTESGAPFAADLTVALARGLEARGIAARSLAVPAGTPLPDILQSYREQGSDRLLLVTLYELKTDVMLRVKLHWSLEAAVYDPAGNLLGRNRTSGREDVSKAGYFESDNSTISIEHVTQKLDRLLSAPAIIDALKS